MSSCKTSMLGWYNYCKNANSDLFSKMSLPDGIDKTTLINNILLKTSEFECLYSDPTLLIDAIGMWSDKWNRTFTKWVTALNIDYNPLDNYDRTEEWSDSNSGSTTGNETNSGTNATNKSAYDSSSLQPYDQNVINNNTTTGSTIESTSTHTGRMHGNIGTTMSQTMLEMELSIDEWNIYEHITDIFMQEFCILVY